MTESLQLPVPDEFTDSPVNGDVVVFVTTRPEGMKALQWAVQQAVRNPGRQNYLHVVLGAGDKQAGPSYVSPTLRTDIEGYLRSTELPYQVRVDSDDPAQAVLDLAHEVAAAMIVLGLRRRSPTLKLILGSHTQQILLDANCPVVAVKA